jgi:purine-nucleoside phosphorylase
MGVWAKSEFGKSRFSSIGIVIAGTNKLNFEKRILSLFDKVVSSKDSVYHTHLVKKKGKFYPIIFNVYGAPAMIDVLAEMHDGGCRTVIFVGYAYGGFNNHLDVGEVVIPSKSYHFEGAYSIVYPKKKFNTPDKELLQKLEILFKEKEINYTKGKNISVPSVIFQLPHSNVKYQKIKPLSLEMELSSCLSMSKDIGIRSAGVLIISDNRKKSIGDKKITAHESKFKVLKTIIDDIENFNLPKLKVDKEFNINNHLAAIIKHPEDITNVYEK